MKTKLILFFVALLLGTDAFAHSRILASSAIPPRNDSAGNKNAPCGAVRTNTPKTLASGQYIRVDWEETVQHPGRYEFYFSQSGDTGWQLLKTVPDNKNSRDNLPHRFTTILELPNVECTDCTIQMIQVMTENSANPSLYFSCSDIVLDASIEPVDPPDLSPRVPSSGSYTCPDHQ